MLFPYGSLVRFRFLFAAFGTGVSLLLVSTALVGQALSASAVRLDEQSELSVLELLSIAPAGEPKALTPVALQELRERPGVEQVVGAASVGASIEPPEPRSDANLAEGFAGAFWLMPRFAWSQPPVLETAGARGSSDALQGGEILLPGESLGVDLRPALGKTVRVEYIRRVDAGQGVPDVLELTVVGLYDTASPRMAGEGAAYVSTTDFHRVFGALLGTPGGELPRDATYPKAWVKAASVADAHALAKALAADGYYVNSGGGVASLAPALQVLRQVNSFGAILLGLFGTGIGVSLSGTWSHLRRWDVGLLSSMGWSPQQILTVYCGELAVVGILVGGSSAGVGAIASVVGSLALRGRTILGVDFGGVMSLPPWHWLVVVTLGTPLALLAGAVLRTWLLTRIQPDEALRRPD